MDEKTGAASRFPVLLLKEAALYHDKGGNFPAGNAEIDASAARLVRLLPARLHRLFAVVALLPLLLFSAMLAAQPALRVEVRGLDADLEKNVRAFLTIEQQKNADDLTAQRMRRYHARAEDEIQAALEPFGYYNPQIRSDLKQIDNSWVASYRIDAGKPVRISDIDIRIKGPGRDEPGLRALLQNPGLRTGERLVHREYERTRYRLQAAALELGYRDASFTEHQVRVLPASNSAEITLNLATGDRYFFGPVTFEGSDLREEQLRGYLPFEPGDPWSNRKMIDFQRALMDSNYFSDIELLPQSEQATDHRIPVEVRLTPRKPQRYSIGVGYTTNTGPRVTLGWQHRQLNRRGHRFEADSEVSAVRRSMTAKYSIPLARPRTDVLDLIASARQDDTDTSSSTIQELRASHAIQRGKLQTTRYLSFKREDYEIGDTEEDSAQLLLPGVIWTWVDADDRLVTRKGSRLQLELLGAHKTLVSDTTFGQGLLRTKTIQPLGERGRLVARADLGGTALSDVQALPASNRFFAGGDQSVRGYAYQHLGPENDEGEVIGGRHLLIGSVEYNYRLRGKWHAALFVDAGNAFNDLPVDEKLGAGVGIRWESPVGMLRLDVAAALSEDDNPLRLHFTFGPDL
ncbi:MAG: autotransporter assembly complex family protein [Thiogranum sp.]|nr:autotransporter assembly complex family protein [Thiogranum sp.]